MIKIDETVTLEALNIIYAKPVGTVINIGDGGLQWELTIGKLYLHKPALFNFEVIRPGTALYAQYGQGYVVITQIPPPIVAE